MSCLPLRNGVRNFIVPISGSAAHMLMLSLFFFFLCSVLFSSARDTITPGHWLDNGETLVSANKTFELGFFDPDGKKEVGRFVGIWHYKSEPPIIVWVANRDSPLPLSDSGVFAIKDDGELKVLAGKNGPAYWSSNSTKSSSPSSSSGRRMVKLMDSGNLVLSDNRSGDILWESFKNPTDTFLPGMKMDETLTLTSWVSAVDPATGNYTFEVDRAQYTARKKNSVAPYWSSKESEGTADGMPDAVVSLLTNSIMGSKSTMYTNFSSSSRTGRLVINFAGEIQFYLDWEIPSPKWKAPQDRCSLSKACGKFGVCNIDNAFMCKCLPGFEPVSPDLWNNEEFSSGCQRKSSACRPSSIESEFLRLKKMKVKNPDNLGASEGGNDCRTTCLTNCPCQAYAETLVKVGRTNTTQCLFWTEDLTDLQEEYPFAKYDTLYVRVANSDIKPTARSCGTCGTNSIPYPLSTEQNCGDPMYSNFECDNEDRVLFKVSNGFSYRVTSINPETLTFKFQLKEAECNSTSLNRKIPRLNPPFKMTDCKEVGDIANSSSKVSLMKDSIVVEISWDPPLEPVCSKAADCKDWPNSRCRTLENGKGKCLCNQNFKWNGSSLNCTQEDNPGELAMPANQKLPSSSSPTVVIGMIIGVVLVVLLGFIGYIAYLRKRTITKRKERVNQGRHLYHSESRVKQLIDSEQFKEEDKKGIDVPFFDFEDILAATNNFSDANMLGRGGFGPVYKGNFLEGREIAVKRLSRASGQGLQEFKNEVMLIAKLQHRNLVRLLGYCIEGDEKILLYEYLPNKSLDTFVFDRTLCKLLNWEKRFDIILGIARGLLYLHQDSRLKIIHRDLKTSNILLDDDMNPKISDFGLARIFDNKQVEASTERIVGTYGYMSPEYALDGFFSEKSDVFSFGVMVLEIISGKRNTGFYQPNKTLSLLGQAWKLWKEEKALELMEETLSETCNTHEFIRCVNVGLLCVQEDPSDRPTMGVAVVMLSSDTATMPAPKQPAFVVKRDLSTTASSSSKPEESWKSEILDSIKEGR